MSFPTCHVSVECLYYVLQAMNTGSARVGKFEKLSF